METLETYGFEDGVYYGVNSIDNEFQIFMVDTDTGKSSWIRTPWTDARTGRTFYPKKFYAGEYGHGYLIGYSELKDDRAVELWDYDFLKRRRERRYSQKLNPEEQYVDVSRRVEDQKEYLYLITAEAEDGIWQATSSRVRMDGTRMGKRSGYLLPVNCGNAEQRADESLVYQDVDGSVCLAFRDGTSYYLYSNAEGMDHNVNYAMGEDVCAFYHLDSELYYTVDCNTGEVTENPDPIAEQRADVYRVLELGPQTDGSRAAVIMQADYRCYPAVIDQEGIRILSVKQPTLWIFQDMLAGAALLFFGEMLLYGVYLLICRMNHGVFPTAFKIVCIAMPLAAAGYLVITSYMSNLIQEQMWSREQERVDMIARFVAQKLEPDYFASNYDGVDYADQVADWINSIYPRRMDTYDRNGDLKQEIVQNNMALSLYYHEDGKFYPMTNEGLICTPISYTAYAADVAAMLKSVEEKQPVSVREKSVMSGEMVVCCAPMWKDQRCVGVVRTMVNDLAIRDDVDETTRRTKQRIAGYMVLMLLELLVIASISLHPLRKMEAAVREMAKGKRRVAVETGRHGEIAQMQLVFNQMADNLGDYLDRTERLKRANEPFVPGGLTRLLGKEDVRTVVPGDETMVQGTVLVLQADGFRELQPHVSAERMFRFMNEALQQAIAAVLSEDGVIERLEDEGMTVIFTGDGDHGAAQGIRAARKVLRSLNEKKLYHDGKELRFVAGVAAGELKLTAVGSEERMEILATAPCIHQAEFLCRQAGEYGAGCIITGTAASWRNGFAGHPGNRLLGYIHLDDENREEPVYEIFEAGKPEEPSPKERTKLHFAVGVMAFEERDWKAAREAFAAILKDNLQDKAAGMYFTLCDQYLEEER